MAADDSSFDIETEAVNGGLDRGGRGGRTRRGADAFASAGYSGMVRPPSSNRGRSVLGRESAVSVDQIGDRVATERSPVVSGHWRRFFVNETHRQQSSVGPYDRAFALCTHVRLELELTRAEQDIAGAK